MSTVLNIVVVWIFGAVLWALLRRLLPPDIQHKEASIVRVTLGIFIFACVLVFTVSQIG